MAGECNGSAAPASEDKEGLHDCSGSLIVLISSVSHHVT